MMNIIQPSINTKCILLSLDMQTDLTMLYSFVRQQKRLPGLSQCPTLTCPLVQPWQSPPGGSQCPTLTCPLVQTSLSQGSRGAPL